MALAPGEYKLPDGKKRCGKGFRNNLGICQPRCLYLGCLNPNNNISQPSQKNKRKVVAKAKQTPVTTTASPRSSVRARKRTDFYQP
jgi:hypothetical protein